MPPNLHPSPHPLLLLTYLPTTTKTHTHRASEPLLITTTTRSSLLPLLYYYHYYYSITTTIATTTTTTTTTILLQITTTTTTTTPLLLLQVVPVTGKEEEEEKASRCCLPADASRRRSDLPTISATLPACLPAYARDLASATMPRRCERPSRRLHYHRSSSSRQTFVRQRHISRRPLDG